MKTIIGLMSGTSMDGVDAAVLTTDGEHLVLPGATHFRPYRDDERAVLRQALATARSLRDRTARPGVLGEAEEIVTEAHAEAVERLRESSGARIDLIGFHGQTVFHAPERRLTVQIGDGRRLADRLGVPVIYDFRAADVAAGGQGAPFVPLYHRALVRMAGLTGDVVVANVGGVGNITRIGGDGRIVSGDTGPGNALMDDLVQAVTGEAMDRDGARAARGRADGARVASALAAPWFDLPMPKSLDRDAFSLDVVRDLPLDDALATLAALTAGSLAKGIAVAGGGDMVVVSGGGAHNPVLLRMLAEATGADVKRASELGWDGDFVEAQAFAYLAARSVAGLPLSLPETTGVPYPMTGGVLAEPDAVPA